MGPLAQDDPIGRGGALEALRERGQIPYHQPVLSCLGGSHGLSGGDSDAQPQRDAEFLREGGVQALKGFPHLHRRPHRPSGIIFVCPGDAEDGEDGVSNELFDGPPVPLNRLDHSREILLQEGSPVFGIEAGNQLGVADEVGVKHGHQPALGVHGGHHKGHLFDAPRVTHPSAGQRRVPAPGWQTHLQSCYRRQPASSSAWPPLSSETSGEAGTRIWRAGSTSGIGSSLTTASPRPGQRRGRGTWTRRTNKTATASSSTTTCWATRTCVNWTSWRSGAAAEVGLRSSLAIAARGP